MDRLKSLEIFKSVADRGSFVKGAEALAISCSAATRAVQELEAALGVQLLQRTSRRIALTDVGHQVLQQSTELLDRYRELEAISSLSASEAAGSVRLVAPLAYGRAMLSQALASFRIMEPRINVELRLTADGDLIDDEADLALHVGGELRQSLIARRVGLVARGLYAAPSYVARRGAPRQPGELSEHDCLTCADSGSWQFRHAATQQLQAAAVSGVLHSNSADAVIGAAVHGAGIVLLPTLLVRDLVEQGRLQPVLPGWQAEPLPVTLAYGSRHQPLRVRKLIEHLLDAIPAATGDLRVPRGTIQADVRPLSIC